MKIGILYNLVDHVEHGFEIDKLSDNETEETVEHVRKALENDYEVMPMQIRRELLPTLTKNSFDFVFNLCEGINGNIHGEAWIPALLDIIGIPYTGSNSLTLGLCLNKIKTKYILIANNISTPLYQTFSSTSQKFNANLKFPLIVKPAHEDASVGINVDSVVNNKLELFKKIEFILKNYHQPALVEEYIHGRELNLAIIGNGSSIELLPISEIMFKFKEDLPNIVSYKAKWVTDSDESQKTVGICPTELSKEIEKHIKRLAMDAYNLTGCKDYARIDFRLQDNIPYILEVNPNPGINTDSGFVRSADVAGMSYDKLIHRILSEAMKRYNIKSVLKEKYN